MKQRMAVWTAGLLICMVANTSRAEPMAAPGDEVKANQVRLAARGSEPGRWGRVQVRLPGDGERRVFVRGLDVSAPLSVQVITERVEAPVTVSLHRHAWAQAQAQGSTGASGTFRFDGRAHGDVGVKLVSQSGAPVRATVLFWQGDPVPRSLAVVYAAPGTARAAEAGMGPAGGAARGADGPGWLVMGGALALVLGAGVAAGLWWRGRGARTTAVCLLGVGLAAGGWLASGEANPARAQAPQKPPDPFDVPESWKPAPSRDSASKDPKPPDASKPPDPFDVPEGWKPAPSRDSASKDPKDADRPSEPEAPKDTAASPDSGTGSTETADTAPPAEGYRERIEAAEAHARELAQQVAANRSEIERLKLLLESDRDAEPQPDRFPPMPLSCRPPLIEGGGVMRNAEADAAWANFERCQQCYAQPLADFENQLLLYERLRVLYNGTRDYVTFAIDLGDKLPKPHSLLEGAWAAQKLSIRRSFDGTKKAYDAKLIEFNDRLATILDRIGVCEAEHSGNPMWRQTTGLFFHRTMATSYQRTD